MTVHVRRLAAWAVAAAALYAVMAAPGRSAEFAHLLFASLSGAADAVAELLTGR
ncbi:hypothetical protein [Streptomyces marincola]|uniref:hypothetical protein n=1 Tax=Streptomyces marincola TaxID=2878388 RepID=UPI00131B31A4|nr:hypothetical protein [Streptomyces marincola]